MRKKKPGVVPEWLRREGLGAFFGSEAAIRAIAAEELAARRLEKERAELAQRLDREAAALAMRREQKAAALAMHLKQQHAAAEAYIRALSIDGVSFTPLSSCERAGATHIWTVTVAASSNPALTRPFYIYFKSGTQIDVARTFASYRLHVTREQAAEKHLSSIEYLGVRLARVGDWRSRGPESNTWKCDVRRHGETDEVAADFEIRFFGNSDDVDASKTFVDFGRAYDSQKAREIAADEFFQRFQARDDQATRISTWSCSPAGDELHCNFVLASQPKRERALSITFSAHSSRIQSVRCADLISGRGWYPIPYPTESFSDSRDFARQPKLRYAAANSSSANAYVSPTGLIQVYPAPVDDRWIALSARASGRDEAYLFSVKMLAFDSLAGRMAGRAIRDDAVIWRLRLSAQNLGTGKLPSREWKTVLVLVDKYGREFRPVHDSSLAVDSDTKTFRIVKTAASRSLPPQTVVSGYVIFILPLEPSEYWLTARDAPRS